MGKKFDAHKKHFESKEIALRQEMKRNNELVDRTLIDNRNLQEENDQLRKENVEIKEKYEEMLKLSKLTEPDIMTILKSTKFISGMGALSTLLKHY